MFVAGNDLPGDSASDYDGWRSHEKRKVPNIGI